MQKSLLVEQAFRIWSVIEDYSPLRGSPCGPLLAQRSLASLESNLPAPGGSHPHGLQMQKSLLAEQAFRIWSVIEDLNLRPLRPERRALPGCANHRMRAHLTAETHTRQCLIMKKSLKRRETHHSRYSFAALPASGTRHQLLFSLIPPSGEV